MRNKVEIDRLTTQLRHMDAATRASELARLLRNASTLIDACGEVARDSDRPAEQVAADLLDEHAIEVLQLSRTFAPDPS